MGGTHANRMIHRETNQLLIGPYVIDATGGERGIMYLNGKAMAIDDLWKNGTASAAYWLWEKR